MIDINLTPKNFKRKKKRNLLPGGFQIPKEVIVGSVGGLIVLLVLLHVTLQFFVFRKIFQHKNLKVQWEELSSPKANVDAVVKELRMLQNKIKSIEDITSENHMSWSRKLNIISDVLPRGVWLRKVALSDEVLFIDGSAVSQRNNELINIHDFANSLKKQEIFMKNFKDLEMGSIQSRKIQQTDLADFLIKVKIK